MGARILVVDDSPTIRRVVSSILSRHGFEPLMAGDGEQALSMLQGGETPVELVLLDYVMPKLSGYEVCRRLRADERLRALPVVLMSAKAEKLRDELIERTGAIDALSKPFHPQALVTLIEGALERIKAGRVGRPAPSDAPSMPPESLRPLEAVISSTGQVHDFAVALCERLSPSFASPGGSGRFASAQLAAAITAAIDARAAEALLPSLERLAYGPSRREVLRGKADAVPLGEVLQVLQMQMQSGDLVVRHGGAEIVFHFRKGMVDLAGARGGTEEFRLGRYLVEEGLIDREALEQVASESATAGTLLGDALVERGKITREQLQDALVRQASELIYEVLRWQRASYSFFVSPAGAEAAEGPRGLDAQLGLPVASLVMEGFRRVDEWRLIEEHIDFEGVLYPDKAAIEAMGIGRLGRLEKMVLDAVDGERTVREVVLQSSVASFDCCRILHQFLQSRLLRRRLPS